MKKLMLHMVTFAAGFALILGAAPMASAAAKVLLQTSHPGGATFEVGTAMGKVITDNSGGKIEVSASITGGSTANIRTLQKKSKTRAFRVGMGTAPAVAWGQTGRKPFKKPQDVLALGALYPLTIVYTSYKTSGIKKWADLDGKRFVVGARGGSIYIVTQIALKHSGMFKKVKREFFSNPQNAAAIKDQRVDAGFFFLNGGVPAPVYMDLARTLSGKLHFFGPDEATIKKLADGEDFLDVAGDADLNEWRPDRNGLFGKDITGDEPFAFAPLNHAIAGLSPGQHSARVAIGSKFYWIYVPEMRDATSRPLNEVAGEIEDKLRDQRFKALSTQYQDRLFQEGNYGAVDEMAQAMLEVAVSRYAIAQ